MWCLHSVGLNGRVPKYNNSDDCENILETEDWARGKECPEVKHIRKVVHLISI